MKRPLKPSEIPPGSVIKQDGWRTDWAAILAVCSEEVIYIYPPQTMSVGYGELMRDNWLIRRSTDTDWKPCWVEEFNKDDYKPGQEVDAKTATALAIAGITIEFNENGSGWFKDDGRLYSSCCKFRVAKPVTMRNIRPDELPGKFIIKFNNSGMTVVDDRNSIPASYIKDYVETDTQWSLCVNGPWHSFQVEE